MIFMLIAVYFLVTMTTFLVVAASLVPIIYKTNDDLRNENIDRPESGK